MPKLPESKKRTQLQEWLGTTLRPWFAGRVLPVTEADVNGIECLAIETAPPLWRPTFARPAVYFGYFMRTANEVINQAIAENRKPEWLLYGFAAIFVLTGEILIGWSLYVNAPITAIAGLVLNGLAWPSFRETKRLRAENLMLRMLEIPLSKSHTAQEAAKMLTEAFAQHFENRVPTTDLRAPKVPSGENQ